MPIDRPVAVLVIAAMLAVAGCAGVAADAPSPTDATDSPGDTTVVPLGDDPEDGPRTVESEGAKQRAIDAENAYLVQRFQNASCLTGWGTTETVVRTTATVAERTAEGVIVEVTHALWYSTERLQVDGASEARYLVTDNDTRRIDGDTVSPC